MSIFNKQWKVDKSAPAEFFDTYSGYSNITRQLLWARGIKDKKQIDKFFNPNYDSDLHDPYLLKDIKKAALRILKAIKSGENILIYGDYDADGVCASTLLKEVLKKLGAKNVKVYIPDRHDEGYGMNIEAIQMFVRQGIDLIVTVDCGSANAKEAKLAQKKGIDVIVTDHHQILDKPDFCYALVNPQRKDDDYPFKGLSGTAVAFKLAQVLFREAEKIGIGVPGTPIDGYEKWLLDLVAISTVTDVMPLYDENRVLLKYGLLVLRRTRRLGLIALIKKARVNINKMDSYTLGFMLGPRLNAAGRMRHANLAFDLLNATNSIEADRLAQQLEGLNKERRGVVSKILKDLEKKDLEKGYAIIEGHESWPIGVLGIAAGRMADKYNKPTFLYQRKTHTLVGSARTPSPFNTVTILASSSLYLEKFGGHASAGGFSALLDNEDRLQDIIKKVTQQYSESLGEHKTTPLLSVEVEVKPEDINWDLYEEIERFAPFGEGNPLPVFLMREVYVLNPQMVGQNFNHFRCYVTDKNGNKKKTIGFNFPSVANNIKDGDKIDIVFNLEADEWNGNRELNLKLIDLKKYV